MKEKLSDENFNFFAVISRQIWLWRNSVLHGKRMPHDEDIIDWCSDFLEEYKNVCIKKSKGNTRVKAKWLPPTLGRLKINVDAAV